MSDPDFGGSGADRDADVMEVHYIIRRENKTDKVKRIVSNDL